MHSRVFSTTFLMFGIVVKHCLSSFPAQKYQWLGQKWIMCKCLFILFQNAAHDIVQKLDKQKPAIEFIHLFRIVNKCLEK